MLLNHCRGQSCRKLILFDRSNQLTLNIYRLKASTRLVTSIRSLHSSSRWMGIDSRLRCNDWLLEAASVGANMPMLRTSINHRSIGPRSYCFYQRGQFATYLSTSVPSTPLNDLAVTALASMRALVSLKVRSQHQSLVFASLDIDSLRRSYIEVAGRS